MEIATAIWFLGAMVSAGYRGRQVEPSRAELVPTVICAVFWPILLAASFGYACGTLTPTQPNEE